MAHTPGKPRGTPLQRFQRFLRKRGGSEDDSDGWKMPAAVSPDTFVASPLTAAIHGRSSSTRRLYSATDADASLPDQATDEGYATPAAPQPAPATLASSPSLQQQQQQQQLTTPPPARQPSSGSPNPPSVVAAADQMLSAHIQDCTIPSPGEPRWTAGQVEQWQAPPSMPNLPMMMWQPQHMAPRINPSLRKSPAPFGSLP
jgi:hypothetical protein